jgi:hypothetical protein
MKLVLESFCPTRKKLKLLVVQQVLKALHLLKLGLKEQEMILQNGIN